MSRLVIRIGPEIQAELRDVDHFDLAMPDAAIVEFYRQWLGSRSMETFRRISSLLRAGYKYYDSFTRAEFEWIRPPYAGETISPFSFELEDAEVEEADYHDIEDKYTVEPTSESDDDSHGWST